MSLGNCRVIMPSGLNVTNSKFLHPISNNTCQLVHMTRGSLHKRISSAEVTGNIES